MLGFLALALVFTSCNKYANDFSALKDQITALDVKVNGVVALQSQLTATTAQVTALQTAVAALPTSASIAALSTGLATANTNIAAAQTALTALATSGTATKAVVDGLKTDLTALAATVAANNTALNTKVDANNTAAVAANTAAIAANAALSTKITAAQASLDAITVFESTLATQAVVNALTVKVDAAQAGINTLLAAAAVFQGAVSINSDNLVDFFAPLFASLGMVQGNVTIDATTISAGKIAKLNSILNNLVAVFAGDLSVTSTSAKLLTLNNLSSVTGNLTVVGGNLSSVSTIVFPVLTNVTGNLILNLDGAYSYTSTLTIGGNLTLTDKATAAGVTGTLGVSIPNWVVTGTISDGVAAGTPTFAAATGINMPTGTSTSITANAATSVAITGNVPATFTLNANNAATVTLGRATAATALTVSATKAASSVTVTTPGVTGNLAITGSATSTVSLPTLVTVGGTTGITAVTVTAPALVTLTGAATFTSTTPLSLPALTTATGGITAATATAVTLPVAVNPGASSFAAAKDLTIKSIASANLTAAILENITITESAAVFSTTSAVLKTISVTGKAATANSVTYSGAAGTALTTATFGGTLAAVSVTGLGTTGDKLTSLTTSGVINSFTLDNSDVITSVSLGHTHLVGGTGSVLVIVNNAKLASLTTSTDKMDILRVSNNALLAVADFSSYHTVISGPITELTVYNNKLGGAYTKPTAATLTTPAIQATITSAALATLKPVLALQVAGAFPAITTFQLGVDGDIDSATTGTQLLSSAATAFSAVTTPTNRGQLSLDAAVINGIAVGLVNDVYITSDAVTTDVATNGINTRAEFSLVQ